MFYKPSDLKISESEANRILEELWQEAIQASKKTCPDCGVMPGEKHIGCCDVARCTNCDSQYISCDCDYSEVDIWDGTWPGVKECYEKKVNLF